MSMEYIRKTYNVPAKRGGKVIYKTPSDGQKIPGMITGSDGGYIRVRLDGSDYSLRFHPTFNMEYLE